MPRRKEVKAKSIAFVAKLRAKTVCYQCGKQPIEWHHVKPRKTRQHRPISSMAHSGDPIEDIKRELKECIPLCRSCHMKADGRYENLYKAHMEWRRKGATRKM